MPPFSVSEYRRRVEATKKRMDERGIELLLVTDPANMCYLTGYDAWSFYVHQILAVPLSEDDPVWIGRKQDVAGAKATTFLDADTNIVGYPDDYVHSRTKHPMDFVAAELERRGWGSGTVAVEMDSYYFTAAAMAALNKGLPNARFTDADHLVNWVRAVKSPAEIEIMRQAARIAESAMSAAVDGINPGVRVCDAVADIVHAQIKGTAEAGGDYTSIVPLLPTGQFTSAPHLTWNDSPFEHGTGTIVELAGCRRRYHVPMARTVFLGEPQTQWTDTAAIVIEGIAAALDAAKPGNTCADIEAAWRSVIARYGIEKESRLGYSTGLNYPPDWGEHTMSLRADDTTELQPNMCFHLIPGLWMDDWGIEISETFRVTENGAEPFCDFPRLLFVKS